MRNVLMLLALALAACSAPYQPPKPQSCTDWTRASAINAAMLVRGLTLAQAAAERDLACGAGK